VTGIFLRAERWIGVASHVRTSYMMARGIIPFGTVAGVMIPFGTIPFGTIAFGMVPPTRPHMNMAGA
jgi:hypothetical protein